MLGAQRLQEYGPYFITKGSVKKQASTVEVKVTELLAEHDLCYRTFIQKYLSGLKYCKRTFL